MALIPLLDHMMFMFKLKQLIKQITTETFKTRALNKTLDHDFFRQ